MKVPKQIISNKLDMTQNPVSDILKKENIEKDDALWSVKLLEKLQNSKNSQISITENLNLEVNSVENDD